jgi:4-hydroxy-2-oxoheptanedioate aldolase
MFRSTLRAKWNAGQATINGWMSIPGSFGAEVMAAQDWDSLTLDCQHGAIGYDAAVPMVQAMKGSGTAPIIRVPWRAPHEVMKALDLGVEAIICPMVNTVEEARELASFCRYPPRGERSFGPTRALFGVDAGYYATANDEVVVLAMIETGEALANAEAIAATEGIDGLYIGPADLTLGVAQGRLKPGMDREEPEMLEAIQTILKAAKNAGKVAALHCGEASYAVRGARWGFDMMTVASDAKLIAAGATAAINSFREGVGQTAGKGTQAGY